jgi:hypothetical protein|tara:strand:+ start:108 stop:641 length:534 start_codon:yes stop_codon:yes gene_type:complete
MKTVILNNVVSEKELYFMYNQIINNPSWRLNGEATSQRGFLTGPTFPVKIDDNIEHYPFFVWGQTIVYRIAKLLESKHIGIPTDLMRMWFNATYSGKKTQHWLHADDKQNFTTRSILLFMTPVWQPDWRGSFYVDGKEYKYKPGSAVIYDSKEFHCGESSESEKYNWLRVACNILVR